MCHPENYLNTVKTPVACEESTAFELPVTMQDMKMESVAFGRHFIDLKNKEDTEQVSRVENVEVVPDNYKQLGTFKGTSGVFQDFLRHIKAYYLLYPVHYWNSSANVLLEGNCSRTTAIAWLGFVMKYCIGSERKGRTYNTNVIFATFEEFEDAIKKAVGKIGEERNVVQELRVRRRSSASNVALRFSQIISKLDWGNEALESRFINNSLYKEKAPAHLSSYTAIAVHSEDGEDGRRSKKKQKRGPTNTLGESNKRRAIFQKSRDIPLTYASTRTPGKLHIDTTENMKGKNFSDCKSNYFVPDRRDLHKSRGQKPTFENEKIPQNEIWRISHELRSWYQSCNEFTVRQDHEEGARCFLGALKNAIAMLQQTDSRDKNYRQVRFAETRNRPRENVAADTLVTLLQEQEKQDRRCIDDVSSYEQDKPSEMLNRGELIPPSLKRQNATIGERV